MRAKLAEITNDGQELIEILWGLARGFVPDAKARDRLDAAKYLADHYFGKAPETVIATTLNGDAVEAAARITGDELRQLAKLKLESLLGPGERIVRDDPGQAPKGTEDAVLVPVTTDDSK